MTDLPISEETEVIESIKSSVKKPKQRTIIDEVDSVVQNDSSFISNPVTDNSNPFRPSDLVEKQELPKYSPPSCNSSEFGDVPESVNNDKQNFGVDKMYDDKASASQRSKS